MSLTLDQQLAHFGELTDACLRDAVARYLSTGAERLAAMLEYHLGWRDANLAPLSKPVPAGKKLRPALVLLVAHAASSDSDSDSDSDGSSDDGGGGGKSADGGKSSDARDGASALTSTPAHSAAVAVELIHNFSLVHDDIQDHSALRRHRPTVWSLWGMPQAINVGDALFALAQTVLAQPGTPLAARLTFELNRTTLALAEGQFLDIDLQEGRIPPTLETYAAMVTRKTGVLFACACRMGAMVAGASDAQREAYAAYGLELGIAFQEQDDLLGVWGRSTETGKPDAADILERKRGLPAAIALSQPDAPEWLRRVYDDHEGELSAESVERIIGYFDSLGVQATIEQRVRARYHKALEHLAAAAAREPARSYLAAICEALVSRRT